MLDGVLLERLPEDLDPARIERIEVVRGESAAALYGARGANGVVVITTRARPAPGGS